MLEFGDVIEVGVNTIYYEAGKGNYGIFPYFSTAKSNSMSHFFLLLPLFVVGTYSVFSFNS